MHQSCPISPCYSPPFRSAINTRSYSSGAYSYGFNGKELDKDEEGMGGGGSTYDYGFRIYNPSLCRFLSIDPLSASYPWYTPYQFAGNKPIIAIDIDGLEELCVNDNTSPTEPNSTTQPAAESCNQNEGNENTQQSFSDDFVGPLPEGGIRVSESLNINNTTNNSKLPDCTTGRIKLYNLDYSILSKITIISENGNTITPTENKTYDNVDGFFYNGSGIYTDISKYYWFKISGGGYAFITENSSNCSINISSGGNVFCEFGAYVFDKDYYVGWVTQNESCLGCKRQPPVKNPNK